SPPAGAVIVDLRAADAFARAHPASGISLTFGAKVGYWAGWVIPPAAPIVLIADGERQAAEAMRQLLRVGLDRIAGWLTFESWASARPPVSSFDMVSVEDLRGGRAGREPFTLLDVRTPQEFSSGHLDGARNVPIGELAAHAGDFPVDDRAVVI